MMSPDRRAQFSICEEIGTSQQWPRMRHDFALLEELSFVRREAQAEANLAYEHWRDWPTSEAYAVYRAAQDQADAAQDDLAEITRLLVAPAP
jgi:hypothetical protein